MFNDFFMKKASLIMSVLLIVLGAINSTLNNASGGTACFAAGIIITLLFHSDVKSFSFFGLAAELREKLNEAQDIIDKLRNVSLPISEIAISSASQMRSRGNPLSRRQLFEYVETICHELSLTNASDENIASVKKAWVSSTAIEMATCIQRTISVFIGNKKAPVYQKASGDMSAVIDFDGKEVNAWDHFQLLQDEDMRFAEHLRLTTGKTQDFHAKFIYFLESSPAFSREERDHLKHLLEEELTDLKYFLEKKALRRAEIWLDGESHLFAS